MKKIELEIECEACDGTGLYSGMGESKGLAVVCRKCKGSGKYMYKFEYNDFTGLKERGDIERVYLPTGYKLGLGIINFDGVGEIDMNKKGVSYSEFLEGKRPNRIKEIECPMMADQGACHRVEGFVDGCNDLGIGWGGTISNCKNQCNRMECWERYEKLI